MGTFHSDTFESHDSPPVALPKIAETCARRCRPSGWVLLNLFVNRFPAISNLFSRLISASTAVPPTPPVLCATFQ